MTMEDRNYLFEEKAYLVNVTMNKHYALIRACRMEESDVYQQLSLRLLTALERYDYTKCPNLDAYLTLQLRYELWNMKACSKLTGVTGAPKRGFSLLSLNARGATEYLAPDFSNNDTGAWWLETEIDALPDDQRNALSRLLSGQRISCNNRALRAARWKIKERLAYAGRLQYA